MKNRLLLISLLCGLQVIATPVIAGNALDNLFDQEAGKSAAPGAEPGRASHRQKASSLDDIIEQEQQEEARQRKIAEEKRKAEEVRQRQLAEEKRRQEEIRRRQLAEEKRRQELAAQQAAEQKKREDSRNVGLMGFMLNGYLGNQNAATAYLDQYVSGESDDKAVEAAYGQDNQVYRQKMEEEHRRQEEAIRRQEEAQRRQQEENNRRLESYNRQQAAYSQQQQEQQEQQRQQAEQRREQEQQRQQEAARQAKLRPVNSCVTVRSNHGKSYLYNDCAIKIEVSWRDQGDCSTGCTWSIGPGTYTSAGNGVQGHVEFLACESPASPNLSSRTCR